MEATLEDQHSHHGHQDNPNAFRSMRDRMHPPRMSAPSCIVPPTEQLVIRPHIVPLLPTFHGMESENPYAHIKEFEDVCNTFQEGGASIDLMRLKLFPFTLKDKAKIWINSLRPRSICTWTHLQVEFLKKFFPTHKTNGLKRQISNFSAKENEKFYECWEKYMEAINACPHHGFDTWLLVSYFYDGMSSSMKQLLETMCGGDFMSKNPEEAMNFLSYVAEARMYTLNEDVDMKAKFVAMTRRLEELELKKMHEIQAVAGNTSATQQQCFVWNTYNSSWRNHPNFSWKPRAPQYQQLAQPSQQTSSLEQAIVNLSKVVGDFVGDQKSINAQLSQRIDSIENTLNKRMDWDANDLSRKIDNLQYSISRLTNLNTVQEKGRFPSQPHQNPKVSMKWKLMRENPHSHDWRKGSRESLLDLEASVNLLPYFVYKQLGLGELKPTSIMLSLADRSVKIPRGIIEDVLVQVDNFYYLVDFVVLDTDPLVKESNYVPIILGRPFLATSNAIINCRNGLMQLTFGNMTLELNIFYMSKKLITPEEEEGPEEVCIIDTLVEEHCNKNMQDKLNESLGDLEEGLPEPSDVLTTLQGWRRREEILPLFNKEEAQEAAKEETPKAQFEASARGVEIHIPGRNNNALCISSSFTTHQEISLLEVLKRCKKAIRWQISDLKCITSLVCTHHIYMEEEAKPIRQHQRRLNPHLQEMVQVEVLKLLQAGIIYPISDSPWVSPTQVVPKKSRITVVQNENGEEIATCLTSGWKVCNMVERIIEVFMDDITIYGGTFKECLVNLEAVLNRCIEKDLVLNWEKCHFYGTSRNCLGHIISEKDIEVDKAKVELIVKLPSPTTVKE
ncbi:hypothetical protein CK203_039419 [Vitis vinifera]|uniref:Retrotransposon gag domain-containing protein n=1 Tax=Vitis vinifera TaxID=29760 RepID=A0A438I766_VITVI|nr:hypothetical protein CK203_039419 [Vitis vinifera]